MKTQDKSLHLTAKNATLNAQGAGCFQHSDPSNQSDPVKEDRAMAFPANIPTCGDSASEQNSNSWKSIGDLAAEMLAERHACFDGESAMDVAARKAREVIHALDNDDLGGAAMASDSLVKFLSDYRAAILTDDEE